MDPHPQPPITLEGWYAMHQLLAIDRRALRACAAATLHAARDAAADTLAELAVPSDGGWSAVVSLVGSPADVLFLHLRPTLDALADVQARLARLALTTALRPVATFLGVTELALYHLPDPHDPTHAARLAAERASAHTHHRLYPVVPESMPYVGFYPTSRRRDAAQNWYTLPLSERSALMQRHGVTGRRHAARVRQIITGSTGLAAWEWGVTLFARDPLDLKRVVTEMRYDEASARYADFGDFYVGQVVAPRQWAECVWA